MQRRTRGSASRPRLGGSVLWMSRRSLYCVAQLVRRRAVRSGKRDATEYRLIIPTIIVLKRAPFLPNYIEEMDLKDLENAGGAGMLRSHALD